METLKTAVVVVLLLAVLYGAYVVLNKPEAQMPDDVAAFDQNLAGPPQIDMGAAVGGYGAPAGLPGPSISPGPATPSGNPASAGQYGSTQHDANSDSGADSTTDPYANMRDPYADSAAAPEADRGGAYGGAYGGSYQTSGSADASANRGAHSPADAADDMNSPSAGSNYGSHTRGAEAGIEPPYGGQYAGGPSSDQPGYGAPDDANRSANRYEQDRAADAAYGSAPRDSSAAETEQEDELPEGVQRNPYVKRGATSGADRQSLAEYNFRRAWLDAQDKIERQQWREALAALSVFYNSPDLTSEQHQSLLGLLDPLAGKVVYSREHLLAGQYWIRRGEMLADIAQQYNVPARLLQKINGIANPEVLTPGDVLKVIPGPFSADIDLTRSELTLFVDGLYAGRFPVTVGQDPAPREGSYQVRGKQEGKTYYCGDGRSFDAADPANPYGRTWIDLGDGMCIHGSQHAQSLDTVALGCISLSPADAEDVYDILSLDSQVTIRR